MKRLAYIFIAVVALTLVGCKGQKRMTQYSELYQERPMTVYVAPLTDLSMRRAVREPSDSVFNASLNIASTQLYLTATDPLAAHGYYVLGPLASAQIAATETRTGKQLRNESIADYKTDLGIDAVLFITIHNWRHTSSSWTVYVEYVLRSTTTGGELMHCHVRGTKQLPTDFKGNPKPLKDDLKFADDYGCDLETAQRCRLVEIINKYVLRDIPGGIRARSYDAERYLKSHPEYFTVYIRPDGSVGLSISAVDNAEEGFVN